MSLCGLCNEIKHYVNFYHACNKYAVVYICGRFKNFKDLCLLPYTYVCIVYLTWWSFQLKIYDGCVLWKSTSEVHMYNAPSLCYHSRAVILRVKLIFIWFTCIVSILECCESIVANNVVILGYLLISVRLNAWCSILYLYYMLVTLLT